MNNTLIPLHLNLDLDDLFDVQSELNPIASNWKNVGLALRMKPDIMDTIQAENPGNPEHV